MMNDEKLDARCPCTMLKVDDGKWVKPADGYLEPDPNCEECKGTGFLEVKFDKNDDNVEAVWVGVCPECGFESGIHLQYKGCSAPSSDMIGGVPACMNNDCINDYCEWIKDLI